MDKENLDKYIALLNREIKETEKDLNKEENNSRLLEILKKYRGEDKIISFKEIEEKVRNEKNELQIMTGWEEFDKHTRGFRPEQLVLLTAVTGSGKTSFCMDLTTKVREYNPVWFPFEESADELVRKFVERGLEVPLAYTPEILLENQIEWIETRIIEAIAKHNSKIVFIDHLEYVVPDGFDEVKQTSKVMRQIKGIAKKFKVTIVLVAHLKKVQVDKQPNVEDIKGSTSITQQADTVIVLWRETKKEAGEVIITDNVNVSIQKNRRFGKCGNIKMRYDNGKFFEGAWETDAQKELLKF
jgi:replicative DNA helicase